MQETPRPCDPRLDLLLLADTMSSAIEQKANHYHADEKTTHDGAGDNAISLGGCQPSSSRAESRNWDSNLRRFEFGSEETGNGLGILTVVICPLCSVMNWDTATVTPPAIDSV